jgi:hypothetical protein
VLLTGIWLGSLLAGPPSVSTRVAATDVAPPLPYPGGTQWTMR